MNDGEPTDSLLHDEAKVHVSLAIVSGVFLPLSAAILGLGLRAGQAIDREAFATLAWNRTASSRLPDGSIRLWDFSVSSQSNSSPKEAAVLDRIRRVLDPYILLMFATVGLAALFPAEGKAAPVAGAAADAGIVLLFFLYGARLSPRAAWDGLKQWRLHLAVLLSTFALFPALGLGLKAVASARLPPALFTGVLFLCVLPSTVQSSIAFTSIARGNVPAALCAATVSNMLGIVLSPLLAAWLLHTHGVQLSLGEFRDIFLQLMAPFLAGQVLRRWIGAWVLEHRKVLGFADRGSILLIIYVAFSKGMAEHIWRQIGLRDLAVLCLVLAALLGLALCLTWLIGRRLLRFPVEDEIVLQFCGSKKSLASGLPMASVLFAGPQLGLIVLPLMLFHQLQLIVCAILARRYAARPEAETTAQPATPATAEG